MKPTVIAEIGWNHMGNMELAKEMVYQAATSGADIAKFQTWNVKRLTTGEWDKDGRRDIYLKAELTKDKHEYLIKLCEDLSISFMSSAFSVQDAELLKELDCNSIKIPSFEVNNIELLEFSLNNFKTIYVSTGTATEKEILELRDLFRNWTGNLIVMHCVSAYPCEPSQINLPRINHLGEIFKSVGFSDHTQGIKSTFASLEFNPKALEKHFTIDHNLPGRDNKFAILPSELKELTEFIHIREQCNKDHGMNYQKIEEDSRKFYRGRFAASK